MQTWKNRSVFPPKNRSFANPSPTQFPAEWFLRTWHRLVQIGWNLLSKVTSGRTCPQRSPILLDALSKMPRLHVPHIYPSYQGGLPTMGTTYQRTYKTTNSPLFTLKTISPSDHDFRSHCEELQHHVNGKHHIHASHSARTRNARDLYALAPMSHIWIQAANIWNRWRDGRNVPMFFRMRCLFFNILDGQRRRNNYE